MYKFLKYNTMQIYAMRCKKIGLYQNFRKKFQHVAFFAIQFDIKG